MARSICCPGCARQYVFPDNLAGKTVKCKKCAAVFAIPSPSKPAAKAASAAQPPSPEILELEPVGPQPAPSSPLGGSLADLLDEPLPTAQALPVAPAATPRSRLPAYRTSPAEVWMTEQDRNGFWSGLGLYIAGCFGMFGVWLSRRGVQVENSNSHGFHVFGIVLALGGVVVMAFALRRKWQVAVPLAIGALVLQWVLYLFSPARL